MEDSDVTGVQGTCSIPLKVTSITMKRFLTEDLLGLVTNFGASTYCYQSSAANG